MLQPGLTQQPTTPGSLSCGVSSAAIAFTSGAMSLAFSPRVRAICFTDIPRWRRSRTCLLRETG